ncbi:MAG: hypothetical protein ACRD2W_02740 [Acidimicrobiales bacterium]
MTMEPPLYQPAPASFAELRVELHRAGDDLTADAVVTMPGTDHVIEPVEITLGLLARPSDVAAAEGRAILRGTSADPTLLLREIGARLFATLFGSGLKRQYRQAIESASSHRPLAVVISADNASLLGQPWELLCDQPTRRSNEFLALSGWPIVRAPFAARPNPERPGRPDLDVLVLTADLPHAVSRDTAAIRGRATGPDDLELIDGADAEPGAVLERIAASPARVFHYAGIADQRGPSLCLSGGAQLRAPELSAALQSMPNLQLVVLNGSGTSAVAAQLAPHVPAVVGVRGQMRGEACSEFADALYGALASGQSVRASVCAGRQRVRYRFPQTRHWSLPVHWDRGDAVLVVHTAPAFIERVAFARAGDVGGDEARLHEERALAQCNLDAIQLREKAGPVPASMRRQKDELGNRIAAINAQLAERSR